MHDRELVIDKAEKELLDINNRFNLVNNQINNSDSELFMLHVLERTLVENLDVLKTEGIVASTAEYKNVKADLARVRSRMNLLETDLKTYKKILSNVEKKMAECRNALRLATLVSISTVIYADFGRKNGQK